ncbi:hypothetical protein JM658_14130 [Joostella atrarenae]|uniref:Outer membrane protein beta-barrel domain-containing protein n=1 Tax=Joostella atrarenae TaxID=679257 RepID=A0ABS9J6C4_9FLAO|nr:hypothetical protein [Joostella atrarenae]MCF8715971.1 hypothetical protein [Joostella atrarenae]
MKNIFPIIAFISFISYSVQAQNIQLKSITEFNYSIGVPTGNLSDFISEVSPRGFSIAYKRAVAPNLYLGGEFGFNDFYEDFPYDTYTEGTASITGYQTRYNTSMPILLAADYIFQDNAKFKPYLGLGIGTIYNLREIDLGLFESSVDTWFFTIKPEAGIIFNINSYTGIKVGAKYYQTFDTKDIDAYSYFSFDIGFVLMHF